MKKTCLSIIILSTFGITAHAQMQKSNTPATLLTPMDMQLKLDTNIHLVTGAPIDKNKAFEKTLTNSIRKASINAYHANEHDTFYSTMPVAGSKPNSGSDNMPVVKLSDTNTRYTMLIKRIDIVDPTKKESQQDNP